LYEKPLLKKKLLSCVKWGFIGAPRIKMKLSPQLLL